MLCNSICCSRGWYLYSSFCFRKLNRLSECLKMGSTGGAIVPLQMQPYIWAVSFLSPRRNAYPEEKVCWLYGRYAYSLLDRETSSDDLHALILISLFQIQHYCQNFHGLSSKAKEAFQGGGLLSHIQLPVGRESKCCSTQVTNVSM